MGRGTASVSHRRLQSMPSNGGEFSLAISIRAFREAACVQIWKWFSDKKKHVTKPRMRTYKTYERTINNIYIYTEKSARSSRRQIKILEHRRRGKLVNGQLPRWVCVMQDALRVWRRFAGLPLLMVHWVGEIAGEMRAREWICSVKESQTTNYWSNSGGGYTLSSASHSDLLSIAHVCKYPHA